MKKHRRVQKQTFQQVSEIFENLRKSSGKNWKMSQSAQNNLPAFLKFFRNLRKLYEVFGNLRKSGKMSESCQNDLLTLSENF